MDALDRLETLESILDRLREPGGCPWDREQTYRSLRAYLLEESYEALDALDRVEEDDGKALCEELGDLLLQIVFLSRLAKEQERFRLSDVVRGISEKMVRRHPHVFGDDKATDSEQVLEHWERIKREEKLAKGESVNSPTSVLDGLPDALPASVRAHRLGTKAARVGFDWPNARGVIEKVEEEWSELRSEIGGSSQDRIQEEFGDVLFSMIMLGRKLEVDPEAALAGANRKFYRRFTAVEEALHESGDKIEDAGLDRLEELWSQAKKREEKLDRKPT